MRIVSPNVVFEIVLYDLGQYGKILLVEFTCSLGLNPVQFAHYEKAARLFVISGLSKGWT